MKKRIFTSFYFVLVILFIGINSCADFDVENLNVPDTNRVYENPDDLEALISDAYKIIMNVTLEYRGPGLAMMTMADLMTCSWENAAMRTLSSEPRACFDNTVSSVYSYVNRDYWQSLNSVLSRVNFVLIQIDDGAIIVDPATSEMIKAWCYFIQGVAHGYLALVMQKGFIIDETTDLSTLEWKTYSEMGDTAITYLDRAVAACASHDFVLPEKWIGDNHMSNEGLAEMCNFYAAKFLLSNPRNAIENAAVDWMAVKNYAQNGLNGDFRIHYGYWGSNEWWHQLMNFSHLEEWTRVDMRVMNMLDPNYPSRWNADGTPPNPAKAESKDARLSSDFRWLDTILFRSERGYYHFSYYSYNRYYSEFYWYWLRGYLDLPVYLKAENDLMEAEALLRTGDKAGAMAILNAGTRVTRGGLDPLDAGTPEEEVMEAIYYERTIELFSHSLGNCFFDMRRRNYLQPGTLLHFPIPGEELENLGEDYYTLGGNKGIPGVDYAASDWGWPGWDVQNPY